MQTEEEDKGIFDNGEDKYDITEAENRDQVPTIIYIETQGGNPYD